jgi:hypothetical protein
MLTLHPHSIRKKPAKRREATFLQINEKLVAVAVQFRQGKSHSLKFATFLQDFSSPFKKINMQKTNFLPTTQEYYAHLHLWYPKDLKIISTTMLSTYITRKKC